MQDIDRKMKLPQQSGEYQKNQEVKEEGRDQRLYKPINTRLQKQHLMDKEKITTVKKRKLKDTIGNRDSGKILEHVRG